MTQVAQWTIAVTSSVAVLAAAGFAVAYSQIEMNDRRYKRLDDSLPTATQLFARAAPWTPLAAVVVGLPSVRAAVRRNDTAVIVSGSVAWLLAFTCVLAYLLVWRLPDMLIGTPAT